MFVGEVRMKISRVGVSWTLSGGNQEVCGPTKSSKYLQVRRATVRRNRRSSDVRIPPRQLFAGRLITITATGKSAHKRRNGRCGYHRRGSPRRCADEKEHAGSRDPKPAENKLPLPTSRALVSVWRRLPFQEQPMRRHSPIDDANNRIERHARVIRQKNNRERWSAAGGRAGRAKISFRAAADGTKARGKNSGPATTSGPR